MDELRRLADAVLYEGYILWPYRRSAPKNRKRWTFGGVYPPRHAAEHPDDRAAVQVQCLVEDAAAPAVDVTVRFLHVVERRLLRGGEPVDELVADGRRYLAWDEAAERELPAAPGGTTIEVPAGTERETLTCGEIVRSWRPLRGRVDVETEPGRVTVRISNGTPWDGGDREDALRSTFCSLHVVLRARSGAFVSPLDADGCENIGLWPVLVGEPGERQTILASPIILPDYPRVAPESPGDLFDSAEIDRLLILNVLSLSEAEQEELRATDPRAQEILDRCAALGPRSLLPLHGVFRE